MRDLAATRIEKTVNQIEWDLATIERGGFSHFMLKEIFEQPETVRNTMRGHLLEEEGTSRVSRSQPHRRRHQADQPDRHHRAAAPRGTPALIGEYMLEELARIPVEVEYASEFRYRNPVVDERHPGHRDLAVG